MSREYMGRIFEMFSRDQNSYKQGIQGTGLGMAITKRIVDLMGGTIRVESEPGKGTTFTIGLSRHSHSIAGDIDHDQVFIHLCEFTNHSILCVW